MNMGYNTDKSKDVYNGRPENASGGHTINCPFCGSTDTELFSLFGSQLLTVQYYCNNCHTPFEHVKDDDVLNAYDYTRKEGQP